jgi:protoporphyrinogen oxidase
VDVERRALCLAGGATQPYDALVSTMPLDRLVARASQAPEEVVRAARALKHNSVYMVGVGYEAPLVDDKSWMYFPGEEAPFYRATNFAKYAAANVPDADTSRYRAFMTETAFSESRAVPRSGLEEKVVDGLRAAQLIDGRPAIASVHVEEIEYAYPVPTLGRDAALGVIQPWLMRQRVFSRGRFGSWRYEMGNMDHAVKMGIDVARHLVQGIAEELWPGT